MMIKKKELSEKRVKELEEEVKELLTQLNAVVNKTTFEGEEVDRIWTALLEKVDSVGTPKSEKLGTTLRNQRWTANHLKIKKAIDDFIRGNYSMPSAYQIGQDTGLSRQTVSKHLKEFDLNDLYQEELKAYELASNMVLERVLTMAVKGDFKAMKFYVNTIDRRRHLEQSKATNNFIQLNTVYITEASIQALPEARRNAIEEIILSENLKVLKLGEVG